MTGAPDKIISGLGPHGERAAAPSRITLSDADIAAARNRNFSVAVVIHTLNSDWSRQSMAGIVGTLEECGARVEEVVDCNFDANSQIEALDRLSREQVDAVVSIPVANSAVAEAHRNVARTGKRLILLDNVPTGLLPGRDYTSLVSADNFGLGLIGAECLSQHVAEGGQVGILTYGIDFFATNEREIAFARWMKANRPDLSVQTRRFTSLETTGQTTEDLIEEFPDLAGLFVVWDIPAMEAIRVLDRRKAEVPVSTVDLGREVAIDLAGEGRTVGIAAQQPYAQGVAVAQTAILSLLGVPVPGWTALPGVSVTRSNVVESYRMVWNTDAPTQILPGSQGALSR
jgi:ribose transport system substrate-binding protein